MFGMKSHPYSSENYNEVIDFLSKLYQFDPSRPYWLPGRWEYATFLSSPLFRERGHDDWKQFIRIVRSKGAIVGMVNSERPDHNTYIDTHPNHKNLVDELAAWAEKEFKTNKISVWSLDDDVHRKEILRSRGYKKEEINDYWNWCDLGQYKPKVLLPSRYEIASFREGFDLSSRIECSSKAFNTKNFSKEVYYHMQKAPHYNPALDLVIKDKEAVVSLCTVWEDPENNLAIFEPVATTPEYQRKGLGLAILNEGMKKLSDRNIETAYVGFDEDWRKSFYEKAGFTKSVLGNPWTKHLHG
jgi:mycothiol synthase